MYDKGRAARVMPRAGSTDRANMTGWAGARMPPKFLLTVTACVPASGRLLLCMAGESCEGLARSECTSLHAAEDILVLLSHIIVDTFYRPNTENVRAALPMPDLARQPQPHLGRLLAGAYVHAFPRCIALLTCLHCLPHCVFYPLQECRFPRYVYMPSTALKLSKATEAGKAAPSLTRRGGPLSVLRACHVRVPCGC